MDDDAALAPLPAAPAGLTVTVVTGDAADPDRERIVLDGPVRHRATPWLLVLGAATVVGSLLWGSAAGTVLGFGLIGTAVIGRLLDRDGQSRSQLVIDGDHLELADGRTGRRELVPLARLRRLRRDPQHPDQAEALLDDQPVTLWRGPTEHVYHVLTVVGRAAAQARRRASA